MFRLALPLLAIALFASSTQAQEGNYFGSGEGGELTAKIKHIENDAYAVSLSTVVPMENDFPGCAGGIDGEALLDDTGGNLFVENENYEPGSDSPLLGEQYCEVKLSFDEDGFLNIEEQQGCLAYHGAACGFSGQVMNENAVN